MKRRALVFAGLVASSMVEVARGASNLEVVYIGGWDCEPCREWKTTYKAGWLASPQFQRVTWVEIESPNLKQAYQDRYWPEDLRPILHGLPHKAGTPRFLIVRDGVVLSNRFGIGNWKKTLADLKKLLG